MPRPRESSGTRLTVVACAVRMLFVLAPCIPGAGLKEKSDAGDPRDKPVIEIYRRVRPHGAGRRSATDDVNHVKHS
jgi:hypothetical protein